MPQHSDNFPSLADIDPVLAEIFYQSYRQFPQILIPAIYTERTSTKAKETDKRVGSLGDHVGQLGGCVHEVARREGPDFGNAQGTWGQ